VTIRVTYNYSEKPSERVYPIPGFPVYAGSSSDLLEFSDPDLFSSEPMISAERMRGLVAVIPPGGSVEIEDSVEDPRYVG
jgi:hypothetical protein